MTRVKKPSPWLLIAIVVVVVALLAYQFLLPKPTALESRAAEFKEQTERPMLTYADPDGQFSFSYPVGYGLDYYEAANGEKTATVYLDFPGAAENFEFVALARKLSEAEIKSVKDSFEPGEVKSFKTTAVNGRPATLLNTEVGEEGLSIFTRQAFIECENDKGAYTVVITGAIPSNLAPDVALADYMISSFRCPA